MSKSTKISTLFCLALIAMFAVNIYEHGVLGGVGITTVLLGVLFIVVFFVDWWIEK